MLNREARQQGREERQQDRSFGRRNSGNTKYKMRERLISIGDDFFIENEDAGQEDVLVLAITAALDTMAHGDRA